MRNLALKSTTGELIVHWDDDDFYFPQRISAQVAPIARGVADVTLLEHQLTYNLVTDELYHAEMPWKVLPRLFPPDSPWRKGSIVLHPALEHHVQIELNRKTTCQPTCLHALVWQDLSTWGPHFGTMVYRRCNLLASTHSPMARACPALCCLHASSL